MTNDECKELGGIRHSDFVIRHSSFLTFVSRLFDAANFVAQFRGLFVFFRGDGFFHFAAQADELRLLFGAAGAEFRHFADVSSFAVNVEEQRLQFGGEADVVVWAAEAALFAELQERDSADGAGALIESGQLFGRFADREMLC